MFFRFLSLFVLAAFSCHPGERVLRVCDDPNNLPFSNNAQAGFENKLAELIGHDLSMQVQYVWFSERKNFLANSLEAGLCDLVPGVSTGIEGVLTTQPYYTSTYVLVARADRHLHFESLYDPQLAHLRIGLHVVEDDYAPPAQLLAAQGLGGQIVGYSLYGSYEEANPPARLVEAVATSGIDVAIVWGPFAGYFAQSSSVPLAIQAVSPNRFQMIPFTYGIGAAVRKTDAALASQVQEVLDRECGKIHSLLTQYGVPLVEDNSHSCARSQSPSASLR